MKKNGEVGHFPGWGWRKNLMIMKLSIFFTCFSVLQSVASVYSQQVKLDLDLKNVTIEKVMNVIRGQSEFSFFFDDDAVNKISDITLNVKDATVEEVMSHCLEGTGFSFRVIDKVIILFRQDQQQKQQVKEFIIKGSVLNQKNEPLPGVTVRLEGTTIGVASDVDGNFTLRLPIEKGTLLFTFVGYKDKKVSFAGIKPLVVQMEENIAALDEVQVIAYGSQKKRTMVSAISSVKAEDIKDLPTHSLESLLQGHMAGVEVNNMSGSPGGGGAIVAIRGYNSIFDDETREGADRAYGTPLYVVDGVPMQSFTSPITGTNTLSDIDPSMIESIEVLKDAASAAIYGSRAGNGVILITTKKGRAGQAKFTANASYSATWLPETPVQTGGNLERRWNLQALKNTVYPYLDSDGCWKIPTSIDDIYKYRGDKNNSPMIDWFRGDANAAQNAWALQDSLNDFYNNSTDWWRYAYRTGKILNANLQASGGSEKFRYMIGAGYYKEEGIMYNSDFQRVNVMTNLTAFPSQRLRLDNQISLTYTDRSRGGGEAGNGLKVERVTIDPMKSSSLLPGTTYIDDELIGKLNSIQEKNHGYGARYNLVLDYEIIRNLHLRVSGGIDYNQQNQNNFRPSTLDVKNHWSTSTGAIGRNISILNENLLSYNFKIKNNHNFDLLLGLSFQKDQSFNNQGSGKNGPNDNIHYVSSEWGGANGLLQYGEGDQGSAFTYESDFEEQRMNSYFGRLSYNFKEKYMFEATVRRDGSSVFGDNVRWATFPSLAAGWAFSEEPFMKSLYWLSFGKIRASWGKSGQKFSQPYLAKGVIQGGNTFLGKPAMTPNQVGGMINRNLTWEETNQYDVGLDLNFFDYRLKLTADYYYRYTSGQLQRIELPGNMLYHSFQWQNALAVSNQGVEIELTADIFRSTAVKWRMKFNVSRNWNRFVKSSDGFDFGNNVIGKSLYQLRAYKVLGIYNSMDEVPVHYLPNGIPVPLYGGNINGVFQEGTYMIADLNGDGMIISNDKYCAASPLPVAYGGFMHEITWKQFDLNVAFSYSIGRHILKIYDNTSLAPGPDGRPLMVDVNQVNDWKGPESKNAEYPYIQAYTRNTMQYNGYYDRDIETVHLLRLKQLTLGYSVQESVARKIGLEGVRMFITAENLFLLTNYSGLDPEIVDITSGIDILGSYPLPRQFAVGLTLNF